MASVAPPIPLEGSALADFLSRLAREQGWSVTYGDAVAAGEAKRTILHGSVAGLTPTEAVAVAIRTSGLTHRVDRGELIVERQP
jgi:hypothetical protein